MGSILYSCPVASCAVLYCPAFVGREMFWGGADRLFRKCTGAGHYSMACPCGYTRLYQAVLFYSFVKMMPSARVLLAVKPGLRWSNRYNTWSAEVKPVILPCRKAGFSTLLLEG